MARIALNNRTIWITGASSGIGRALTTSLLGKNNRLILTARNQSALEEIRESDPERIHVVAADISDPGCAESLRNNLGSITSSIDTVILNAGTCEYVDVDTFDAALVERVLQVNLLGLSRCVEASLPLLKKSQNHPHIVGISSAAAITGLPRAEAYGASKAAVVSFLESLGLDLNRYGIEVSVVYPGFVETPLTDLNDFPMPFIMDVNTASELILDGIEKRKLKVQFPKRLIWLLKLMAALPERLRFKTGLGMVRSPT